MKYIGKWYEGTGHSVTRQSLQIRVLRRLSGRSSAPVHDGVSAGNTPWSFTMKIVHLNATNASEQRIEEAKGLTQVDDIPRHLPIGLSQDDYNDVEKQLKCKLDCRLMVTIVVTYTLNFLDRIPSNIFLAQLRPSIYLPTCMVAWGILSTCTGAVQGAGGLYSTRFLLGFVEAAFYPGSVFLIGSWYTRAEAGIRCAFLYSGALVGSAFSGLIAAGIHSGLDGALGLASWRWVFIIEGSITVFLALCSFFILPDYPANTRWLSDREQVVAQWRLKQDAANVSDENEPWAFGFKCAFTDWRTYVFALLFHCVLVTTSTQNFFPSVVQTLGFDETATLLLTVPPYAVAIIASVVNNWSADRLRNSSYHVMWPLATAAVGCILGVATLNTGARYFAMILMVAGGHSANAVAISWTQKTILRPRIKRAAAVAFVNACGNPAQIWTSYLYFNNAAPRYVLAMSVNAGFAVAGITIALIMRSILLRANRRLATGADASVSIIPEPANDNQTIEQGDARPRVDFRVPQYLECISQVQVLVTVFVAHLSKDSLVDRMCSLSSATAHIRSIPQSTCFSTWDAVAQKSKPLQHHVCQIAQFAEDQATTASSFWLGQQIACMLCRRPMPGVKVDVVADNVILSSM
nr:putative transporter [Quercus suber]